MTTVDENFIHIGQTEIEVYLNNRFWLRCREISFP
jgi:hypothetical protein